ncbi:glucokinase [Thalassobaculum sp.]|uniref:glucokinase n=1 Tax=Thalassobaculum sp. TaxID=2022740 RepID=UPI003B59FD3F
MTGPILIADLGGTNLRFALTDGQSAWEETSMEGSRFATLDDAVAAYLARIGRERLPERAIFAVAGPSDAEKMVFTNRDWTVPVAPLRERFGLKQLAVVNDFAAVAHALPHLTPDDCRTVGAQRDGRPGPMVAIGPGTGLGVGLVVPDGRGYRVIPGEGGHATLAAQNGLEERVIGYLRNLHGHVSAERALSGAGLADLHDAVCAVEDLPARRLDAAAIVAEGATDPGCREAIGLFTDFLATVSGDLALTAAASGGVFIAGGMVPKLGDLFDGGRFRRRFTAKGRLAGYLDPIPVRLITHRESALLGLSRAAKTILKDDLDTSV